MVEEQHYSVGSPVRSSLCTLLGLTNPKRGKGTSKFITSGEEDVDRAFPCLVPVSVKDPERAMDLYQARYAIIH